MRYSRSIITFVPRITYIGKSLDRPRGLYCKEPSNIFGITLVVYAMSLMKPHWVIVDAILNGKSGGFIVTREHGSFCKLFQAISKKQIFLYLDFLADSTYFTH